MTHVKRMNTGTDASGVERLQLCLICIKNRATSRVDQSINPFQEIKTCWYLLRGMMVKWCLRSLEYCIKLVSTSSRVDITGWSIWPIFLKKLDVIFSPVQAALSRLVCYQCICHATAFDGASYYRKACFQCVWKLTISYKLNKQEKHRRSMKNL